MPGEEADKKIRLDAFLARAGCGTRSEVRQLIRRGRVSLDETVCRRSGEHVQGRTVRVDGEVVQAPPDALHVVLHKPLGVSCSHDPREEPLVDGLLPATWQSLGIQMVGRLDRDTTGLLVLTTDGVLLHQLTHPSRKVIKRYRVVFSGSLPADAVERCGEGFLIGNEERPTRPARLEIDGPNRATIHLREGRNRQVRRMFQRLGVEVVELHRDRVGAYELPEDLRPGEWALLGEDELERLLSDKSL